MRLKVTNLATNTALTAVENKIPCVSNLAKKNDYNTKISRIEKKITDHDHNKYIISPELNEIIAEDFVEKTEHIAFSMILSI